jgi:hypothetical protein
MEEIVQNLLLRIERLPQWLRPVAYGPCLLLIFIVARGGVIVLPILAVYLLFFSHNRLAEIGIGVKVLAVLFGAAALGGLIHGLVGRRIMRAPLIGAYLAGILATAPYMAAVGCVIQLRETGSLLAPWDDATYFTCGILSLLFGPIIGHNLFRD